MRRKVLVICGLLILVAAALTAVPRLMRPERQRFDTTSVDELGTLYTAQYVYERTHPERGFASSLSQLGPDSADSLIDPLLATGNKDGYLFVLTPEPRDARGRVIHYSIVALPQKYHRGTPSFYIDETGVERFARENRAATVNDSPVP
jgi:hypothetical protein